MRLNQLPFILAILFCSLYAAEMQAQSCDSVKALNHKLHKADNVLELPEILQSVKTWYASTNREDCGIDVLHSAAFHIAEGYFYSGRMDSAKFFLDAAIFRDGLDTSDARAKTNVAIFNLYGNMEASLGNYLKALIYYRRAIKKCEEWGFEERANKIRINEAAALVAKGNYEEALRVLHLGLEHFKKEGDSSTQAILYNNLGELYREQFEEVDKAVVYYHMAIRLNKARKDNYNLNKNYNNLLIAMGSLGRIDSAAYYYQLALQGNRQSGNAMGEAIVNFNYADCLAEAKRFKEAEKYYNKSLEQSKKLGLDIGLFYGYLGMAGIMEQQDRKALAEDYYRKAREVMPAEMDLDGQRGYYRSYYEFLKKDGRYREALEVFENFYFTSDSLNALNDDVELMELRALYEADITELENRRLRNDRNSAESQLASTRFTKRLYVAISILLAALVVVLGFFIYSRGKALKQQKVLSRQLRENNEALEKAQKELAGESAMKTRILSVLGHDLRSPFSNISGLLQLLQSDMLTVEESKEMLAKLGTEVDNTLTTLSNIITWSKIQLNENGIRKTNVRIADLAESVRLFSQAAAQAKEIEMEYIGQKEAIVPADENQLRSILTNLLNNAIKFSPRGAKIKIHHHLKGDVHILEVSDEGAGMSEEMMNAINQKEGLSAVGTEGESGTGLGLTLVQEFVALHHGSLHFLRNAPQGTIVRVELPA